MMKAQTEKVHIPDIAEEAEQVILGLIAAGNGNLYLKTNQIRKFLAAVNTLTNKVEVCRAQNGGAKELSPALGEQVKYLKVKFAYQAGRERTVRELGEKGKIKERIDRIGLSVERYERFARFIEALVAYHKFHGGKD